ncbi:hypothetical protein ACJVW9_05210, partial [Staphylococcus pseudintermedius]|uniref:hypothetical protein n=1 Tax=Staphylococcus pseudintermedius TaxID=283734 RepID=UPI00397EEFCE
LQLLFFFMPFFTNILTSSSQSFSVERLEQDFRVIKRLAMLIFSALSSLFCLTDHSQYLISQIKNSTHTMKFTILHYAHAAHISFE